MVEQNPVAPQRAVPSCRGPRSYRHLSSLREIHRALRDIGELQEGRTRGRLESEIGAGTLPAATRQAPRPYIQPRQGLSNEGVFAC